MTDATPTPQGVQFPATSGGRRTSETGRRVFAAAASAVDRDLAGRIRDADAWHERYADLLCELTRAELQRPGDDPEAAPRAGLDAVHASFTFHRGDTERSLADALTMPAELELQTTTVRGRGQPARELEIPYAGRLLRGDDLRHQLRAWVTAGTIEPSAAASVELVAANPDWLDLSDLRVVVLGAASEMGPLGHLLRWGATVVPVDLPRPRLWERILGAVREGTGEAQLPVRHRVDPDDHAALAVVAGADLATEVPELAAWLSGQEHLDVVGTYVYADGADNVRVSLAADVLATELTRRHPDTTLAGLLTPTDVYAAPVPAVEAAVGRLTSGGLASRTANRVSRGRGFRPQYEDLVRTPDGEEFGLADGQVPQQGPNYALAKRLARWRFRVARADGIAVSANVAPATSTRSVTSNRLLAAAYAGAHHFGVEVFAPETSTALMAAMLVRDLRDPLAPGRPEVTLGHPLGLFADAAAHGGLWRLPWAPRSVLPLAAVLGLPRTLRTG
ncbi:hypothetical protein [Egicoccus sp. AB-alg6-2]|uniref:hypothetical protein n=1 Tax=Egicoccus sp. AB-alg6-2 TaxID=3242692 RepID=UPI00359CC8FE